MSRNNASFAATAAAFHNAHVSKLKTLNADPVLTLTKDGNFTQDSANTDTATVHATKGKITMYAVIAGGATVRFTMTNRLIKSTSKVFVTAVALNGSGATPDAPLVASVDTVSDGSCQVVVYNPTDTATVSIPVISYFIVD